MRQLYLYLHTHWDREWYCPYETYRVNLVACLKQVIEKLEDGSLSNFYLDGQALALEDALELAPDLAPSVKSLMASAKLLAGPWYVLADQMLVSGESLIRNLQSGIATVTKYGQSALIGYCPDTFGHSQDLPRILSGFGIKEAIVWRGVPAIPYNGAKHEPIFSWQSPDGSRVLACHLGRGYYQTGFHENLAPGLLANSLKPWLNLESKGQDKQYTYSQIIDGTLYPVGGDHVFPPGNFAGKLSKLKDELNDQAAVEIKAGSLTHFLDILEKKANEASPPPAVLTGELRDNQSANLFERAYLLPGVTSTRLYLKRQNRLAERRLFQVSEALYSLLSLNTDFSYPHNELDYAQRLLLSNQPHDSICGTSVDDVHEEMVMRYKKIHHLLDALDQRAETHNANAKGSLVAVCDQSFKASSMRVFNLSNQTMSAPVSIKWTEDADSQELAKQDLPESSKPDDKSSARQIISKQFSDKLFAGAEIIPYYKFVNEYEALVYVDDVPPFGYKDIDWPPAKPAHKNQAVEAKSRELSNGLVTVKIDESGQLTVTTAGKTYRLGHNFVDVGDGGDSYNFDPIPSDTPIAASLQSVKIGQQGPLLGSLILTYEIEIPEEVILAPGETIKADALHVYQFVRSKKTIKHVITSQVSLKMGSALVHFETTWENKSKDHRLEVVFDTGSTVEATFAENHFSLIERKPSPPTSKLPVLPGSEAEPDRFPCQRFFIANGQLFLNCGLPEYGIESNKVSLTVLRAISYLSRGRLQSRGGGAGPKLATPEANCLGINCASYAWAALPDEPQEKNRLGSSITRAAYNLAEQYENKLWATLRNSENENSSLSLLASSNPAVHLVSLYTGQNSNHLFARFLNLCDDEERSLLTINFQAESIELVKLDETVLQKLPYQTIQAHSLPHVIAEAKVVPLDFRPNELVTIKITR